MIIFNESDLKQIENEIKFKTEFQLKKQEIQKQLDNLSPERFVYELELKLYEDDLSWEHSSYSSYKIRHFSFDSWLKKMKEIFKSNVKPEKFLQFRYVMYEIDNVTTMRYRWIPGEKNVIRSIKSKLLKNLSSKDDEKVRTNKLLNMNMNFSTSIEYEDEIKLDDIKYLKTEDMQSVQGYIRYSMEIGNWKIDSSIVFAVDPKRWKDKSDNFYKLTLNSLPNEDLKADDYIIEFEYLKKDFSSAVFYDDLKVLLEKTNTTNNFQNYIISKGVNDSVTRLYQYVVNVLLQDCITQGINRNTCEILSNKYKKWYKLNSLGFANMLNNPINLNVFNVKFFLENMKNYYVTPKLDGERIVFVYTDIKIELLFANNCITLPSFPFPKKNTLPFVFECEYIEKNNKKYIFIFNQITYNKKFEQIYNNRLISSYYTDFYREFNKNFPDYYMSLNEFREISSMSENQLFDAFNLIYKDDYNIKLFDSKSHLNIKIDGIILTHKLSMYDEKRIYKYKRPELSTIDVLVKSHSDEIYFLFCSISGSMLMTLPFDVSQLLKDIFKITTIISDDIYPFPLIFGYNKTSFILNNDCGVDLKEIDNTICEFQVIPIYEKTILTGMKYKFIRKRDDKTSSYSMGKHTYGNFYSICCDAVTEVLNPITPEKLIKKDFMFHDNNFENTYFTNVNKLIIKNIPMEKTNTSILTFHCGTGDEYFHLIEKFTSIFGIDEDIKNLVTYQKRILSNINPIENIKLYLINDDVDNPIQMYDMLEGKLFDIILVNRKPLVSKKIIDKYLHQYGFFICYVKETLEEMKKKYNDYVIEEKQIVDSKYFDKFKKFYMETHKDICDIDWKYNYYILHK